MALYIERSAVAVNRAVGKILIRFDPLHHRQALLVRPIRVAELHPDIQVGFQRAQHGHYVDGRATAHDFTGERIVSAAVEMSFAWIHP